MPLKGKPIAIIPEIGVNYMAATWIDEIYTWSSISPSDDTILEQGMVLTLEPTLELGAGRMMVHEEVIVLRESGADQLTERAPKELSVIN